MARMTVPIYQGLSTADFTRPATVPSSRAFPFTAAHRLPFYRARNAIYYLMAALVERRPGLTVLAPDYNSGNEILAIRAAGAQIRYYPINRRMQLEIERCEGISRGRSMAGRKGYEARSKQLPSKSKASV